MNSRIAIVIPARYASSRLPGKPLIDLNGKSMIEHVYQRASSLPLEATVVVATDDERIEAAVRAFGGQVMMTPQDIPTGSERVGHIAKSIDAEIIVNLQGDEPLVPLEPIVQAIRHLQDNPNYEVATIASALTSEAEWQDPAVVKVLLNASAEAIYFSRSRIPFFQMKPFHPMNNICRHIGVYVYRKWFLMEFLQWPQSQLELCESLEQLRIIERGIRIPVLISNELSPGVDVPEDVEIVKALLSEKGSVSEER